MSRSADLQSAVSRFCNPLAMDMLDGPGSREPAY